MFRILYELDAVAVQNCPLHMNHMLKGGYFVPEPNYVWSMNGHHKLCMNGFEIYAGVDAYSQYVPHQV